MIGMILISVIGFLAFSFWYANDRIQTKRLLRKHQAEWDAIKKKILSESPEDFSRIGDEYLNYIEKLYKSRGYCGACFPRM